MAPSRHGAGTYDVYVQTIMDAPAGRRGQSAVRGLAEGVLSASSLDSGAHQKHVDFEDAQEMLAESVDLFPHACKSDRRSGSSSIKQVQTSSDR
jgi:hypothetical protein